MKKFTSIAFLAMALAVFASSLAHAQGTKWASLKGQFLYGKKGTKMPTKSKLTPTKDVETCGKFQLYDESLVVNPENRGIAGVVLWAYKPKRVDEKFYEKSAKDTIKLDNKNCRFEPHVLAVRTGQTLEVLNSDPVGHNSKIDFIKNNPLNPMLTAGNSIKVVPTKTELVPITVSCSIHPWMSARLLVQDHPYMAVTDADGKFEIKNLPADEKVTLKVWTTRYIEEVTIDGKKTKWRRGRYELKLKSGKDEEHEYILDPKYVTGKLLK